MWHKIWPVVTDVVWFVNSEPRKSLKQLNRWRCHFGLGLVEAWGTKCCVGAHISPWEGALLEAANPQNDDGWKTRQDTACAWWYASYGQHDLQGGSTCLLVFENSMLVAVGQRDAASGYQYCASFLLLGTSHAEYNKMLPIFTDVLWSVCEYPLDTTKSWA